MADLAGPNPDEVNGLDARGAAITAKPVIVGGRASSVAPATVSDGQSVDLWLGSEGHVVVSWGAGSSSAGADAGNQISVLTPAGAASVAPLGAAGYGFNGATWDRLRTVGPLDAFPNVDTGVLAVGIGPGYDRTRDPANLGSVVGNTSVLDVMGASIITVAILTSTTGTFTIEAQADGGTIWVAPDTDDAAANTWVSGTNLTPTAGKVYKVRSGGYRQIRLRTVTTLGATVAHKFTGHAGHVMPVAVGSEIAAITDAMAITSSITGSATMVFNGTTWDRLRSAGGTGSLAVGGTVASGAAVTANPLLDGGRSSLAVPTAVGADGEAVALWTDRVGRLTVKETAGTAALTNVASSASNVTLLAANTSRLAFTLYNDSTQIVYVKYGATASATSFTYRLWPGAHLIEDEYTGQVDAIWVAANGNARLTELS